MRLVLLIGANRRRRSRIRCVEPEMEAGINHDTAARAESGLVTQGLPATVAIHVGLHLKAGSAASGLLRRGADREPGHCTAGPGGAARETLQVSVWAGRQPATADGTVAPAPASSSTGAELLLDQPPKSWATCPKVQLGYSAHV